MRKHCATVTPHPHTNARHNTHAALFNLAWNAAGPDVLHHVVPEATSLEEAAYTAGVSALAALNLAPWAHPQVEHTPVPEDVASRLVALVVAFTRRYPHALTYPGRIHEAAWPVLAHAHTEGLLAGVEDLDQLRRVLTAAAAAVTATLNGPAASWWAPCDGQWLWASTTRSLTTGRALTTRRPAIEDTPAP